MVRVICGIRGVFILIFVKKGREKMRENPVGHPAA
jgi:hypothetical protein